MYRKLLRAKIHRATVNEANVDYEGSITLPPVLMHEAGIAEYEAVNVWDVSSGARLETYAIRGQTGSSRICINGAAARLIFPGDVVIIASFSFVPQDAVQNHAPTIVFVDRHNGITAVRREKPALQRAA